MSDLSRPYAQRRELKRLLREAHALAQEIRGLVGVIPGAALVDSNLTEAVYESCEELGIPYGEVAGSGTKRRTG